MQDTKEAAAAAPPPAAPPACKPRDYKVTSKANLDQVRNVTHSTKRAVEQMRPPINDLERTIKEHVETAHKILKHAHELLEKAVAVNANS